MRKQTIVQVLLFAYLLTGAAWGQSLNEQLFTSIAARGKSDSEVESMVAALLASGADVNARGQYGKTPLRVAASYGNMQVVELLISKGADVNAKNDWGQTPLFFASSYPDVSELLISKGADVNAKDENGATPLFEAVKASLGRGNSTSLLISKGADVNAKDKYGATALFRVANGNTNAVELLIAKAADVNSRDADGETPIFYMVRWEPALLEFLIAKGADVNAKDAKGQTALFEAANWSLASAKILIAKGADINAKDSQGRTPLDVATIPEVKAILIAMGGQSPKSHKGDLQGLLADFKGNSDNEGLRAEIINLESIQHASIPADAESAAGRGAYIFKNAKSSDDTLSAAKEYLSAIEQAPWVANYYYNLCTVLEKTPYTQQTLHACKLYLLAAPNAPDASDMKQRIAGLHYAADRDHELMKQRTAYVKSRGMEDLYRFGGISGKLSDKDITLKLVVDWYAAPPKFQVFTACLDSGEAYGDPHDLVTTDIRIDTCKDESLNMHLVIRPEGDGFIEASDATGNSIRASFIELFAAKQKTLAQSILFTPPGDDLRYNTGRYYVAYVQGGINDGKHLGWSFWETQCNGTPLKQDPRALPDVFSPGSLDHSGFYAEWDSLANRSVTDLCASQFTKKTGYKFGEME